jgi:hypothetical protein
MISSLVKALEIYNTLGEISTMPMDYGKDKSIINVAIYLVDELISSHNNWDEDAQWNTTEYYYYKSVKKELEEMK